MKVQMISAKGSRKGRSFYTNRRYANALSRLGLATYADAAGEPAVVASADVVTAPEAAAVDGVAIDESEAEVADEAAAPAAEDADEKPRRKYKTRRLKAEE